VADDYGGYNGVVAGNEDHPRRMLVARETKDHRGGEGRPRRSSSRLYTVFVSIGYGLSVTGFVSGIVVLRRAVHDPATVLDGAPIVSFPYGDKLCPGSDLSFPPCRDWKARQTGVLSDAISSPIRLWRSSIPAYRQWLQDNAEVNAALTDPVSTVLSRVSDAVMGRLFDETWVTKIDLAVDHP